MSTYKEKFEEMLDEAIIAGSVLDSSITAVENQLGVQFPKQYFEFVKKYGSVLLEGREVCGIVEENNEPPLFQTVINETVMRRENNNFFSDNPQYIPIATNGASKVFFIDTSVSPKVSIKSYEYGEEKFEFSDIYQFILSYEC